MYIFQVRNTHKSWVVTVVHGCHSAIQLVLLICLSVEVFVLAGNALLAGPWTTGLSPGVARRIEHMVRGLPYLIVAVMQAHDVRANAREHDIHLLQQIGGIVRRNDLDGYLHPIRPSYCAIDRSVRSTKKCKKQYKVRVKVV